MTRTRFRTALVGALAALMAPAGGVTSAQAVTPVAHVRFIYLAPDYPANVDFYIDGYRYLTNVVYKSISYYYRVSAANHDFVIRPVGSRTATVAELQKTLDSGSYNTLVVSGKQSDIRIGTYVDSPSETAGKVVVRFCHFAPEVPGVNVAAVGGQANLFTNIGFTQCSDYGTIDPGQYQLELEATTCSVPTTCAGSNVLFQTAGSVAFTAGTVNTVIGTGGEGSNPVTAMVALDAVSAVRAPNGGATTGKGGLVPHAASPGAPVLPPLVIFLLVAATLAGCLRVAARSRRQAG
jgi:hypothetical protein